ncbi:type II toxin-antitoxin system PemK/MazF family toxin [Clostridium sp.]|uniref:type II toxin-antitoxin system PemK/MazF family toxin n=1 Tax=Clostridium sp. TaxID=1506 RepID=UPI001A6420F7|nr:type II toxin-antitoxin system PemK/MazF family toxin [Clostridium sp.]MBK5235825.1 type II toxin-antitoxin system PemK/MazF family toxin [Clostridium sp.]
MSRLGDFLPSDMKGKLRNESRKQRGTVHYVGFPYKFKLPFYFFNCCLDDCANQNCKECGHKSGITCDGCTQKIKQEFEFCKGYIKKGSTEVKEFLKISSKIEENKNTRSLPANIIQRVKVRPYLILSSNANLIDPYVYGAPITSLKPFHFGDKDYMELLKTQQIPTQYYLESKVQGVSKPSYIDLSGIMPIHRNLVIDFKGYIEPQDMIIISNKINLLFDLKQFRNIDSKEELNNKNKLLELENKKLSETIQLLKRTKNTNEEFDKDA